MQLLQACTFDFGVPHNIVGHIIAFSNVVHAFDDSSHQSHMLHQVCVCVCMCVCVRMQAPYMTLCV